ncbi:hypothetical protein NC651_013439 [Populus alba x Populus x berolinensis]|nr:hypothetical protein NC651_013439 [Populus alba x Populus x berolinensis]
MAREFIVHEGGVHSEKQASCLIPPRLFCCYA